MEPSGIKWDSNSVKGDLLNPLLLTAQTADRIYQYPRSKELLDSLCHRVIPGCFHHALSEIEFSLLWLCLVVLYRRVVVLDPVVIQTPVLVRRPMLREVEWQSGVDAYVWVHSAPTLGDWRHDLRGWEVSSRGMRVESLTVWFQDEHERDYCK